MFQALLANWLRNAARQQVMEAVAEAAQRTGAQPAGGGDAPSVEPCAVGIVFATAVERAGTEDVLQGLVVTDADGMRIREGGLAGRRVAIIEAGAGLEAAQLATEALIAGHRPAVMVAAGLAAALQPRIARGEVVFADRLIDTAGGRVNVCLPERIQRMSGEKGCRRATQLTAAAAKRRPVEKRRLGEDYSAAVVDAGSMGVALACRRAGVPFLSVYLVHEAVDEDLTLGLRLPPKSAPVARRLGAALGALIAKPSTVKEVLAEKQAGLVDTDRLAQWLTRVVGYLAPEPSRLKAQ